MIILNVLFLVAFLVVLLGSGGLLVIAPEKVVSWLRQQSQGSKILQLNPFLSRSWYPTYLRMMGLFVWIFALVIVLALTGYLH